MLKEVKMAAHMLEESNHEASQQDFLHFVCIHCLCQVKDVGSKSSCREFSLQIFQLLYTLTIMSRTQAHTIHMHSSDTHTGEIAESDIKMSP